MQEYWIKKDQDAILQICLWNQTQIHVYISKDYNESSINFKMDGVLKDTVQIEAMSMEIPVYEYEDSKGNIYMQVIF